MFRPRLLQSRFSAGLRPSSLALLFSSRCQLTRRLRFAQRSPAYVPLRGWLRGHGLLCCRAPWPLALISLLTVVFQFADSLLVRFGHVG